MLVLIRQPLEPNFFSLKSVVFAIVAVGAAEEEVVEVRLVATMAMAAVDSWFEDVFEVVDYGNSVAITKDDLAGSETRVVGDGADWVDDDADYWD